MDFYMTDLRVIEDFARKAKRKIPTIKPYMEEMKESNPERYERIVNKYNDIFKDMKPNDRTGPPLLDFLKDIFCDT